MTVDEREKDLLILSTNSKLGGGEGVLIPLEAK